MRGTQNPQAVEDGAQEFRQRNSRPLSRPSPSANLAGIWKGDPLGFRAAKSPRSPRHKRVAPAHGDNPRARAATSELGYDNERNVRIELVWFRVVLACSGTGVFRRGVESRAHSRTTGWHRRQAFRET